MTATEMIHEIQKSCPSFRGACPDPVFIIGSPRSGTSVLAWALAQHSELWTSGEIHILYSLFRNFQERFQKEQQLPAGWIEKQAVTAEEFLACVGVGFNALFTSRSEGKRWVEQTPVNTEIAPLLASMFPGARFLHILRDGRSVVSSMVKFYNSLDESVRDATIRHGWYPVWATSFATACDTWKQSVEAATALVRLHPDRCFTISYEALVANPELTFKDALHFLGLSEDPAPAVYFRSNRIHSSHRTSNGANSKQKTPAEIWSTWTSEQKDTFNRIAGDLLLALGFASPDYAALIRRVWEVARAAVPSESKVLVVSKGDDDLLKLEGRTAAHFPQNTKGGYAGFYPLDDTAAIAHLESLRAQGWDYLLLPNTAFWWLDHYLGFRDHLEGRYLCIWSDENCRLYAIREPRDDSRSAVPSAGSHAG